MTVIHPTAIVSPDAQLADDVTVEAYSIIGPHVVIGPGSVIGPHAVIDGWTTLGERTKVGPFSSIGGPPQDFSYAGEPTRVLIGSDCVIRENVAIHRGTQRGAGVTRIGDHCYLMATSHVAHDCQLGHHVILANGATLGGHVQLGDHASIGGLVALHQFVRIGTHGFIGGMSGLRMDFPPYMLGFGAPAKLYGPNVVGLRRQGIPTANIQALKRAYRIIFKSGLVLKDAVEKVRAEIEPVPEVETLLTFMTAPSKRGVTREAV